MATDLPFLPAPLEDHCRLLPSLESVTHTELHCELLCAYLPSARARAIDELGCRHPPLSNRIASACLVVGAERERSGAGGHEDTRTRGREGALDEVLAVLHGRHALLRAQAEHLGRRGRFRGGRGQILASSRYIGATPSSIL